MDLALALENAKYRLDYAGKLISRNDPLAQTGFAYVSACKEYRKIACLNLLQYADLKAYRDNLNGSARLWYKFLQHVVPQQKCDPEVLCGSRFLPLFDALAAGNYDLAADIAALFPTTHQSEWEYEDDYFFYQFVCQFLLEKLNRISKVDFNTFFVNWENILQGGEDSYLELCQSLVRIDVQVFFASLQTIVDEREAKFEAWRETPSYQEEVEDSNRYIYINGIGIARLAKLVNIQLNTGMLTLPDLALKA